MKEEKLFKVVKKTYYSKEGKPESPKYYVKEQVTVFFGVITYWKYITYSVGHWNGVSQEPMVFGTHFQAVNFIKTILCPEVPRERTVEEEVQIINCSSIKEIL